MIRRFSVIGIPFIRRPVSEVPPDGKACIVDNGHPNGWTDRQPAVFEDGEWKGFKGKLRFVPKYWTELDHEGVQRG